MTAGEYVVFFSTKSRWALAAAEVAPLLIFLALTTVASVTRHVPYLPAILTFTVTSNTTTTYGRASSYYF